ncbi:MAG: carboxylating nicotinate-nucleotide diphosphorylase [Phycisphaerales bacterium]
MTSPTDWNTLTIPDYAERVMHSGHLSRLLELARDEDLGPSGRPGDITTLTCSGPDSHSVQATLRSRQPGTAAGLSFIQLVCERFAPGKCRWTPASADGQPFDRTDALGHLTGPHQAILVIERTLLNLVSRLSGIATLTSTYIDAIRSAGADPDRVHLLDTRKTTPGHRLLEKYAVRCGGGYSHRIGLYDAILIKDNHIAMAPGGLTEILDRLQQARDTHTPSFIEIEVDTQDQLQTVLKAEQKTPGLIDIILLDNMNPDQLTAAVRARNDLAPRILLEASGGITLETIGPIAQTGIDRISTGAITHQARSVDLGLDAG